jgi:hypothetical protein
MTFSELAASDEWLGGEKTAPSPVALRCGAERAFVWHGIRESINKQVFSGGGERMKAGNTLVIVQADARYGAAEAIFQRLGAYDFSSPSTPPYASNPEALA